MAISRPRGNHIKPGFVLMVILALILFLMLCVASCNRNYGIKAMDDRQLIAPESYGAGEAPVENIGRQRSDERETLFRQLDEQMYQFTESREIK